jgi:two-component system OmpR family sensor kinase
MRRRDTLTGRLVLLGVLTALLSAVAVGLVSVPLIRAAAQASAQAQLARAADTVTVLLRRLPGSGEADAALQELQQLRESDVDVTVLQRGQLRPDLVSRDLLDRTLATGAAGGTSPRPPTRLVETRLLRTDTVVVLSTSQADAVNEVAAPLLRRFGVALLAGSAVAGVAGALVAGRLAKPLRETGEAARRLSRGERSLRVDPDGPTEVVEVAEALNGLADALQASESRQRRFLLSVSHELRTPLTAVRGYAEALSDGVVSGPDAQRAGQVIVAEADRLDALMKDLLALARSEADDFALDITTVDLDEVLDAAAQSWAEPVRQAGLTLRTEHASGLLAVAADAMRTRQVLDALVANAVRVTPAGRPVVLATTWLAPGHPAVQVRDGGPGLHDDDLPVAFDAGVLRDRYEGTRPGGSGIGLALVERLTTRMGGRVVAGHAPEGGAAFTVALPSATAGRP